MKKYLVKIELKSFLATPLLGDTLFGHICWGIFYREGEKSLNQFLQENKESPKILLSDGFPENYLPLPFLKSSSPEGQKNEKEIEISKKMRKKICYIPKKFIFDGEKLTFRKVLDYFKENNSPEMPFYQRTRNIIDRFTQTTTEGGLFTVREYYANGDNKIFDLYVVTEYEEKRLKELLLMAFERGYGADKATGAGIFELKSVEEIEFPEGGDYLLALSSFILSGSDKLSDLRANTITKFGKIGYSEDLSSVPFKKPMIMFKAGATFKKEENRVYIGKMMEKIHKNPDIVHWAYAPLIPFNQE